MSTPKTKVQFVKVSNNFIDQRIDNFLMTRLKGMPKSHLYRLLRKGEVRVNKKRIAPSYRLQEDDEIRIPPIRIEEKSALPKPSPYWMTQLKNRILLEDDYFLIINKPSGIPVHGGSKTPLGVIEILRMMYPQFPHLELAHRLDADTSGCLILAKKRSILRQIHELLRENKVKKIYHALTLGHWQPKELKVNVPLQKNILSSGERIVRVDQEGKDSTTHFKVVENFKEASLVTARLLTGRTHQIRVHTQYQNHPIAGDEKYGDKTFNKKMRQMGLKRLFLHASEVSFKLPEEDEIISVFAPLDDDLEQICTTLRLTHPKDSA